MNSLITSEIADVQFLDRECSAHGLFQSKTAIVHGIRVYEPAACPHCVEEREVARIAKEAKEAEAAKSRMIAEAHRKNGLPDLFDEKRFADFSASTDRQKRALSITSKFAESFIANQESGNSLILAGKPGTGKTHLAAAVLNAVCDAGIRGYFISAAKAIRLVKDTYRRDSERSEQQALDSLIEQPLLILDEVGVQVGSEHEKMLMFEIINERYQWRMSTILISNLYVKEISDFLGDRVVDRFRENGAVVAFDWESHRGKKS
jgi:DNA replication protein DnaC